MINTFPLTLIVNAPNSFNRYFASKKYASFARQISHYGFFRFLRGPNAGAFYHNLFLRGRPDLILFVQRHKCPTSSSQTGATTHGSGRQAYRRKYGGEDNKRPRTSPRRRQKCLPPILSDYPPCRVLGVDEVLRLCCDPVLMPLRKFSFSSTVGDQVAAGYPATSYDVTNDRYNLSASMAAETPESSTVSHVGKAKH